MDSWTVGLCPAGDGIYFPDDTWVPLSALSPQDPRRPMPDFSDFLTRVHPGSPLASNAEYVLVGGETAWEGGGFLALIRRDGTELLWILHSSESEPFVAAALRRGNIKAFSSEYPSYCEWSIPLLSPWGLSFRKQYGQ